MMPDDELNVTQCVAGLSVASLIVASVVALWFLNTPTSFFDLSQYMACVALWLGNLISMLLNAVFWFIRRSPRWLRWVLAIQAGLTLAGLLWVG
ncbi:hypothetical protein [Pseudomonas sp. UBA6562]|uniref:hypothetical protein n=1 Tax=Pseudomonas sp. UBA6562 TaxID=1947332 RepID=UPI0025D43F42|nr:hypothetical protein [Pseudomonas sp. UBA6562]